MITFKGSKKDFFKAYPKDKRSLDEVYCIVSYNIITKQETKTCYQFVGSLSEKNFKKIEVPKLDTDTTADTKHTNVSNVQEVPIVDDVTEEKEVEPVTEVDKNDTKEEVVDKPIKRTIKDKRKDLTDAFYNLAGIIGIENDKECMVDFFAMNNVLNDFERCDFCSELSAYIDLFKEFLIKYPEQAKDIQTCLDNITDVYNDIIVKKAEYDRQAYNFYHSIGIKTHGSKRKRR